MSKYLYVVDHFVPAPLSEYGGIWNVIASDEEEVYDLIVDEDDDLNTQHYSKLRHNIINATKYQLVDDVTSEIVTSFLT